MLEISHEPSFIATRAMKTASLRIRKNSTFTKHQGSDTVVEGMKHQCTFIINPSETLRWRAFKIGDSTPYFPDGEYAEVWDTEQRPFEASERLPSGTLVVNLTDLTFEALETKIEAAKVGRKMRFVSSWVEETLERSSSVPALVG